MPAIHTDIGVHSVEQLRLVERAHPTGFKGFSNNFLGIVVFRERTCDSCDSHRLIALAANRSIISLLKSTEPA